MSISQSEIDSFHKFASERMANGGSILSWHELVDLWQIENPSEREQAEIYAAINESLEDIKEGRHQPADQVMSELREKHDIAE